MLLNNAMSCKIDSFYAAEPSSLFLLLKHWFLTVETNNWIIYIAFFHVLYATIIFDQAGQ